MLAALPAQAPAARPAAEPRLLLVTLDGLPWREVFQGADPARAADRGFVAKPDDIRREFLDPADRARALMPFLHGVVATQGVLLGDRAHGSCAAVANDQGFSYPGYNEILTGRPDPAITSNEHGPNRNVTVLEWLNRRPGYAGRVEAVASWATFNEILNEPRSGLPVNAGWETPRAPSAAMAVVARLQDQTPRHWAGVRFDAFTHAWALDALRRRKPRVLYVAYGETDDFAHDGRYDQMLWAARRTDGFLAELWAAVQADPAYAGRTTLIITTDHGRGSGPERTPWRSHGKGLAGSNETWIAAIGPTVKPGAAPGGDCALASQVAATALTALGEDWRAFDPAAGRPLEFLTRPGR